MGEQAATTHQKKQRHAQERGRADTLDSPQSRHGGDVAAAQSTRREETAHACDTPFDQTVGEDGEAHAGQQHGVAAIQGDCVEAESGEDKDAYVDRNDAEEPGVYHVDEGANSDKDELEDIMEADEEIEE